MYADNSTDQSKRHLTNQSVGSIDTGKTLAYQLKRDWKVGDVYAPHDLSGAEMRKWATKKKPDKDVFDILAIDPLSLYKVSRILLRPAEHKH